MACSSFFFTFSLQLFFSPYHSTVANSGGGSVRDIKGKLADAISQEVFSSYFLQGNLMENCHVSPLY